MAAISKACARPALAYFGKEPKRLTVAEAALLVALPQLPETRRPDRNRQIAQAARDRVLGRMVGAGLLGEREADARGARRTCPATRLALPALAAHARRRRAAQAAPAGTRHQLTLQQERAGRRSKRWRAKPPQKLGAKRLGRHGAWPTP